MNVALAHFRVGETDGVSLEMDKWKTVLESMGHTCAYIAGSRGACEAHVIEDMRYESERNNRIVENSYHQLTVSEKELEQEIHSMADEIERKLLKLIDQERLELVIPNNIWSLGWNLPTGIAFARAAARRPEVRFIGHHHDFYWERSRYWHPTTSLVSNMLAEYFPPKLPNTAHCVINGIAQEELDRRRGIGAAVVPNVFDFSKPAWQPDAFNADFREACGIGTNDLVFLQATRITERKAIEFAVGTVGELMKRKERLIGKTLYNGRIFGETSRIIMLFIGLNEAPVYWERLQKKMKALGIEYRYVNDRVGHSRETQSSRKTYAIWDSYAFTDFVTYPSILEGWGNQLLEAVFARKPLLLFEYPVFLKDIKQRGIRYTSLGNTFEGEEGDLRLPPGVAARAAENVLEILLHADLYHIQVQKNYDIAKMYFSYERLEAILRSVIGGSGA